jgi:hypothetical protein
MIVVKKPNLDKFTVDEDFSAKIVNVSSLGLACIQFNTAVRSVPDWSFINSSVIDMYVEPAIGRENDASDFNASLLNFTWGVEYFLKDFMFIKLNFTHPHEISPEIIQDKLVFHVKPPGLPLFRTLKGQTLPLRYQTLKHHLSKQM